MIIVARVCDECNKKILNQFEFEIVMGLNRYEFCCEKHLREFAAKGKGKYNSYYA